MVRQPTINPLTCGIYNLAYCKSGPFKFVNFTQITPQNLIFSVRLVGFIQSKVSENPKYFFINKFKIMGDRFPFIIPLGEVILGTKYPRRVSPHPPYFNIMGVRGFQ